VKETLFNILGHRLAQPGELPGFDVLDVFAGSGSLGIEAVSRGARTCIFVERDQQALRSLRDNLQRLHLGDSCTILTDNAWTMRPPQTADGFGLIFVDPPYQAAANPLRVMELLERLAPSLAPDGLLVFRQSTRSVAVPVEELRGLQLVDERVFRYMRLMLLARRVEGD